VVKRAQIQPDHSEFWMSLEFERSTRRAVESHQRERERDRERKREREREREREKEKEKEKDPKKKIRRRRRSEEEEEEEGVLHPPYYYTFTFDNERFYL